MRPADRGALPGVCLAAAALILFVILAELVRRGMTMDIDRRLLLWFNAHASPGLDGAALEITALGSATVTVLVVVIGSGLLLESHHRYSAALLWVSLVGGWLLSRLLKSYFDRPRPDVFEWRVPYVGSSSYPSGHSVTAMAVYATLGYLVVHLEFGAAMRRITVVVFAAVILLVGISRVYLGVHYPTDVVGGFLLGLGWATISVLVLAAMHERRNGAG